MRNLQTLGVGNFGLTKDDVTQCYVTVTHSESSDVMLCHNF